MGEYGNGGPSLGGPVMNSTNNAITSKLVNISVYRKKFIPIVGPLVFLDPFKN